MGLDMYLEAREFASQHYDPAGVFAGLLKVKVPWPRPPESFNLGATIGYWRKDNQIHGWFVDHTQSGDDQGQESGVSLEQLIELRDLCRDVLAHRDDPEYAMEHLPPREGFFFGAYEIDDDYYAGLTDTDKMLTDIVEHPARDQFDYYYRASW